jgi:hypothetical protein
MHACFMSHLYNNIYGASIARPLISLPLFFNSPETCSIFARAPTKLELLLGLIRREGVRACVRACVYTFRLCIYYSDRSIGRSACLIPCMSVIVYSDRSIWDRLGGSEKSRFVSSTTTLNNASSTTRCRRNAVGLERSSTVYLLLPDAPGTFWVFFGRRTAWMLGRTPP